MGCKHVAAWGVALVIMAGSAAANAASDAPEGASLDREAAARLARRAAAKEHSLALPLPNTPDTKTPLTRLAAEGLSLGARIMMRIFKAESELEIWVEKDGAYVKFATYPICYWSGKLGPKLREGDRQTPEGFYTVTPDQLHYGGRWRRSLDIGFPNAFDTVAGRSGSAILIHGGCDSIGCFAMTDAVNAEIYDLVSSALRSSTKHVPVHVFPFRMSDESVASLPGGAWTEFWGDLKQGYDSFERTHLPPRISVCGKRYRVADAVPVEGVDATAIEQCMDDVIASMQPASSAPVTLAAALASSDSAAETKVEHAPRAKAPRARKRSASARKCSMSRPSCRRWTALRQRGSDGDVAARYVGAPRKRSRVR